MILVCGTINDPMIQLVIGRLQALRIDHVLLDELDLQQGRSCLSVEWLGNDIDGTVTVSGRRIRCSEFTGAYSRCVGQVEYSADGSLSQPEVMAATEETRAVMTAFMEAWPGLVANRPSASKANHSKPFQQLIIERFGFSLPVRW
jgi:hypothetical protein